MSCRQYGADCHRPPFLAACLIQRSSDLPHTQYTRHLAFSPSLASSQVSKHLHSSFGNSRHPVNTRRPPHAVLTFIDASAPSQGVPESLSSYLISITNAGNAIGRLAGGVLGDQFGTYPLPSHPSLLTHPHRIRPGPINVMIPASLIAGILTLVWPYTHGIASLFTLAGTYGAASGAMVTLMGAPMMALGDSADVGRRTGMYFSIISVGALAGPPISGAIELTTGRYIGVGIFAGAWS
jgi:MCP family monocarboxylic acid transporter-like MFS transporter 10